MPLAQGQLINNRYRIARLIAQGGFGAVYRAWDTHLNRPCALKENLNVSPEAQEQFKREAQILADLIHPNLPNVLDHFVIPDQGQYLVMDFVEGEDLEHLLQQQGSPLPEAQVLPWIDQVSSALSYLHEHRPPVIHRDIKPANIKITPDGRAVLVDFGISKIFVAGEATAIGAKAVTPGYSPPEQYIGMTDARSDIYALGATLYRLLTGQRLPESTSRAESAPPFPLPRQLNPAISPNVEQAILRALDTNREKRFQTIQEMRQALVKPAPIPDQEQSLSATLIVQPPTGLSQYPAQPSPGQQFPTAGTMAIPQTGAPPSPARTLPGWLWAGAGLAGLVFICLAGVILMRMFSASGAKPAAGLPSPTSLALSATLSPTPIAASPVSPTPGQPAPTQPSITQALPPTQPLPPAAQPPQLPAAAATLQLEQAFNCRGGPNVQYDLIWTFSAGTVLQIIGKSENNWWLVRINDPRTRRQQCWIGGGVPQGDLSQVPISEWTGTTETAKTPWP